MPFKMLFFTLLISIGSISLYGQESTIKNQSQGNTTILPALYVMEQETANQRPANTYESPISNLDFDPRVDMQTRNMAEAQGDLSVRGGTFENTGIQIGSATLLDPQTGHYSTEIPVAPEMLGEPRLLTGANNALHGFNSSTGTVSYSWSEITKGGSLTLGGGDHNLNFQRLHNAWTGNYDDANDWSWGAEIETSRSESDGTIPFGDHAFDRSSARIQLLGKESQTDIFGGYQSKFFGWPEMYAAPYGSNETEYIKTRLFMINHLQNYGERSNWEATAFHRRNSDHYIFNRLSPNNNFIHETKVSSFAVKGAHEVDSKISLNYNLQVLKDEIRSTKLENTFTNRNYYKLSILPEYAHNLNENDYLTFKGGLSFDDTNRDKSKISPIAEISWDSKDEQGNLNRSYLSYSQSTKVLGYGAIGGPTSGLFASDPSLLREVSKNLELGYTLNRSHWTLDGAFFYRWDRNLVDWTYESNNTSARSANNVNIDTFGFEIIGSRRWNDFESIASYSYLNKNEDYKNIGVDGSFYALNFPEHRVTFSFIWTCNDLLEIRMDNEWRDQKDNPIREGPSNSLMSHIGLSYYPAQYQDMELFIAFEKPWDENFQDIPGTPGKGDQFSFGATYSW